MQWLSSGIGGIWPGKNLFGDALMSAIAVVYTPRAGFVIGADGRARWNGPVAADGAKKQIEPETEKKIFEATAKHATIAYGITGKAYNDDKSFSVVAESQKAATTLSQMEFTNHLEYVERFCELVSESIAVAHAENRFDYLPARICAPGQEKTISRFVFCGYFRRRPFAYDAEIINEDETLVCHPTQWDVRWRMPMVLGSEKIAKLMYPEPGSKPDSRFKNYTVRINDMSSMMDAIACVRGYLEACSTPLARQIDPFCEIVGGRIHIATITPQFDFNWSTPPVTAPTE